MNRCKTCKWWTPPELPHPSRRANPYAGNCGNEHFKTGNNPCPEDGLSYWDTMVGWDSGFNTGPEFGCIHHEPTT